jgi:hypothetical protein
VTRLRDNRLLVSLAVISATLGGGSEQGGAGDGGWRDRMEGSKLFGCIDPVCLQLSRADSLRFAQAGFDPRAPPGHQHVGPNVPLPAPDRKRLPDASRLAA